MKAYVICAVLAIAFTLVAASRYDLIDAVNNNPASTWIAGVNQNFARASTADIKKLLGWRKEAHRRGRIFRHAGAAAGLSLPDTWDATQSWPNCTTIGNIQNQASCGSCWAFGCVESVSDRFCIHSDGAINQFMSFQQMVSCGPGSCEGGDAGSAWDYVKRDGLVSNDNYPYEEPTCPPAQQPCTNFAPTAKCKRPSSSETKYYLNETYGVRQNDIQGEMITNGPVEMCFDVYEDFVGYKSGVYSHQSGGYLGGHCVKCIGWGNENGSDYWLCNNSWTTYWGDNGQFKILRGSDECGIESDVVAGMPKL
eukprot:TRINITY_DN15719_c0_g1_i1.p1 TRINITY_DN15719_c0_g1~~TRINITY_DN15719_c0_g1_i1.p1  ORF type:complete len:309 (-),score=60.32 TRINITY_DN15719_c0_g1_i1:100-1026(-)